MVLKHTTNLSIAIAVVLAGAATVTAQASDSVATVISELQQLHGQSNAVFVEQQKLDGFIATGGGGACPTATAVNALQVLRVMAGVDPLEDPYRVAVEVFNDQPRLLEGRVSNSQFILLLERLGQHLPSRKVQIIHHSAGASHYFPKGEIWTKQTPINLSAATDRLLILAYTVTKESQGVLGRHFVVLKDAKDGQIDVFDPTSVEGRRAYKVDRADDDLSRVFLRYNETFTNELCDVFEIRLQQLVTDEPQQERLTVPAIVRNINSLAATLVSEGKLRSPRTWRKRSSHFQLSALDMPESVGGLDWPATKMIEVFRAAGRHDLNLRDVVGGAHGRVLLHSTSPQVRKVASAVARGDSYIAIVITEPLYGTDYRSMETTSTRTSKGYVLTGQKLYNARLEQATHFVVFAKSPSGKPGKVAAFLVPRSAEGVEIQTLNALGLKGNSFGGMTLNDVTVPKWALIGDEENGSDLFESHFRYWRMMQTAAAIGTGEAALQQMAKRLLTRKVNGRPIGRFTHLQQPLAQHSIELEMAYALLEKSARHYDNGDMEKATVLINGLKAEAVEAAIEAVDCSMRAFGAEGYSDRVDLGSRMNDLLGLRIADGTTDVMRSAVASALYGEELWYMAIHPKRVASNGDSQSKERD